MFLTGRRKRKKERKKEENSGKVSKKESRGQTSGKWLVRRRLPNGTLKHVVTLPYKPTAKDLASYGPAEFMIQRTGRRFSKAEKIVIPGKPANDDSVDRVVTNQMSTEFDRDEKHRLQRPVITTRRPFSETASRSVVDNEKDSEGQVSSGKPQFSSSQSFADRAGKASEKKKTLAMERKTPSKHKKVRALSGFDKLNTALEELNAAVKQALEEKKRTRNRSGHPREGTSNQTRDVGLAKPDRSSERLSPRDAQVIRRGRTSSREWVERSEVDGFAESGSERSNVEHVSDKRGHIALGSTHTDRGRTEDELATLEEHHRVNLSNDAQSTTKRRVVSCSRCNKTLIDETDLWLSGDEVVKCEFCSRPYCPECYREHRCPKSGVCFHCKERVPSDSVHIEGYCSKTFCSIRCRDLCRRKNEDDPDCKGCKDTETDRQECLKCETIVTDEDGNILDDAIVCLDDDCESVYCSRRCFLLDHKRKGLDHEHVTWKEYLELADEDERE
ncbi:MAG: hypothetical protein KAW39_00940 [Thermoplasmata archaeon]|nr:hypothetical protein [Thermoplasmata archaeon]